MDLEFDPAKDAINVQRHGVSLRRAADLDIEATVLDGRYDELRFRAYGRLDGLFFCLAFTYRDGRVRAISLRRAHAKEYEQHVSSAERL